MNLEFLGKTLPRDKEFIERRVEEINRQDSFHQMYGGVPEPLYNIDYSKNDEVVTPKIKQNLELKQPYMYDVDLMQEVTDKLINTYKKMQDDKFLKWIDDVVLSGVSGFEEYTTEIVNHSHDKINHMKIRDAYTGNFLDLYVEKTEVVGYNNQWVELQWNLQFFGKSLKEGRDFLNMEVKLFQ
ncbi:hypothetical protein JANET_97 [Bacillus phage Janet]|nr:hypothetical protein JANET_97 [Bacillus phage Janet]